MNLKRAFMFALLFAGAASLAYAQRRSDLGGPAAADDSAGGRLTYMNGDPYGREPDGRLFSWPRRPSDLSDRRGVPEWPADPHFKKDGFTFARVNYHSFRYSDSWATDYPDSELNFSFRVQELMSFKVNPEPVVVKFTDPDLFDYPFIYMVEVGTLEFEEDDVPALRRYLLNGGFLMVDNFFGEQAWNSFHKQMQRVFPDREPVELDLSHPIFHTVFDLKEKPQIPKITHWARHRQDGFSALYPDETGPHYWAYTDDKGRLVALICHNTDLGNGWSRELSVAKMMGNITLQKGSENDPGNAEYFHEYCEKWGYPMGVNILVYVMTH